MSVQLFQRCTDIESTLVDISFWLTVYLIKCGMSARLGFDVGPASLTLDQHRACGVLVPRVYRVGIHAYLVYCCASRIVSIFFMLFCFNTDLMFVAHFLINIMMFTFYVASINATFFFFTNIVIIYFYYFLI